MKTNSATKAFTCQLWNGGIDKDGNRYIGSLSVQCGPDGKMTVKSGRYPEAPQEAVCRSI